MNTECSLSLHDAELVAVAVDRHKAVACLDFCLEDRSRHVVELRGLKSFRCEDLTLQNVVNRVLRSSSKEFSAEYLAYWTIWSTSLSDSVSWLSEQRRQEWIDAYASGALELVVLEPSAGAQLAAVCEKLVLLTRQSSRP